MTTAALPILLKAKAESDRKNYRAKAALLRQLMEQSPHDFEIDSEEGPIVGLTHKSGFRIHLPRKAVPDAFWMRSPKVASWQKVGELLVRYVERSITVVPAIRGKLQDNKHEAHWHPERAEVRLSGCDKADAKMPDLQKMLEEIPGVKKVTMASAQDTLPSDEPWVLVKKASPATEATAQWLNWMPGGLNQYIGGPSPLAATLTGGVLGGGAGYLAGLVGEKLFKDKFEKGRLRRVLAAAGAAAGAAPGAWWGTIAHRENPDAPGWSAWLDSWPVKQSEFLETPFRKVAELGGAFALSTLPSIPRNEFGQVVWQDPYTPLPIRAATTGLVDAAAMSRGTNLVSPADIARIGLGMGSGYVSGLVVGKTLGALAGLKPEAQQSLQQAGTWAGLLTNVVPMAFGRS